MDRVRIITVLDLVSMERDGKIYIARQYGEYGFELELELGVWYMREGWMVSDDIVDAVPMDSFQALVPFGFLYEWWRGFATLTGRVVGGGMQAMGLW